VLALSLMGFGLGVWLRQDLHHADSVADTPLESL
jgi:hypothetical protein